MTDVQLHHVIDDIGATLLNRHGRVLQDSFARYGATMGDRRFPPLCRPRSDPTS